MTPTLEQVKDFAAINAIPEKAADEYWPNFECQDWVRANSQKITKWQIHFKWWVETVWRPKQSKVKKISDRKCWCGKMATLEVQNKSFCCPKHREEKLGW